MGELRIDGPCVLLDTEGVARLLAVRRETISAYLSRGYLPAPAGRIAGGPVWDRSQILAWVAARPGQGAGGGRRGG